MVAESAMRAHERAWSGPGLDAESSLSRGEVVERIRELNPTAGEEYLAMFRLDHLRKYLDHLVETQRPRGRHRGWLRPGDAPSVLRWEPAVGA